LSSSEVIHAAVLGPRYRQNTVSVSHVTHYTAFQILTLFIGQVATDNFS